MINGRANLVLVGVGHSGTTILAKMLQELGWNLPDADARYAEHKRIRDINRFALSHEVLTDDAEDIIAGLATHVPWVIKDPRFTVTLHLWQMAFEHLDVHPTLIWLKKCLSEVKASYIRRGELVRGKAGNRWKGSKRGLCVDAQWDLLNSQIKTWHGPVFELEYEQMTKIRAMFTPS